MASRNASHQSEQFAESLLVLGFSQYEARCYVGLLGPSPQTGYAVSKTTGVPQPKVYETLRRLVARGAARLLAGEPARFAAIPPAELLDELQTDFDERLGQARETSIGLEAPATPAPQEPVAALVDRAAVLATATSAIAAARRRIYLSGSAQELSSLKAAILAAAAAGVDVVVLAFGRASFRSEGVRMFHHSSTDGSVFRHHQARHIALVADSAQTVFGLAADGRTWSGIETSSPPIIAAVKGYIRHDIDLQQVFRDFGAELVAAYGPGLQGLENYRATAPETAASSGHRNVTRKAHARSG